MEDAQLEGVSLDTQDGMKLLFDLDEPQFSVWIRIYAALYGLRDMGENPGYRMLTVC